MISDHILCMHRYRSPGEQDGEGMILSAKSSVVFEYQYKLCNMHV